MAETIRYLVDRGIPVMAHIGLTPQAVNVLGGFKVQGRSEAQWDALLADARAVTEAGAFSVVLEAMPGELAARITEEVPVPTIGIGASAACDGQILVMDDMLGMAERVPKFVKRYAEIGKAMDEAIATYAREVQERSFPAVEHTYSGQAKSKG
jgi:3-methyl-2-oxobutanoate hydroxymethyltransferase